MSGERSPARATLSGREFDLGNLDDGGRAVGGGLLDLRFVFIKVHAGLHLGGIRHLKDLGSGGFAHAAGDAAVDYFNFGDGQSIHLP